MSELATLETSLLSAVSAAADEAALEAVRVAALGKQGSVSALLKTLGSMTPDERKSEGPLINGLRDRIAGAIAERRGRAEGRRARRPARRRDRRRHPAGARSAAARGRIHPISQVMDEITAIFADMGFAVAEGPGHRDRLSTISPR